MESSPKKRGRRSKPTPAPGRTVEAREKQLINLAVDLAEKQLADGTATAQVITHFLKLGTVRAQVEVEKLRKENALLQAKTESLQAIQRQEELFEKALEKMSEYKGQDLGGNDEIED